VPVGEFQRDEQAVSDFVERFAAELTEAGVPRMPSRVFSCLMAEDSGALSSAELAERLRVSPAAISGAVRYLAQMSLVSREREPGSRRERYRVHDNVWYESMTRRDRIVDRWGRALLTGVDAVGTDSPAGRRLTESAEFFQFLLDEMQTVLDRWKQHRAEQGKA
jgi:DNA-binding transcriptional regulator GbsR (MarR family)